MDSDYEEQAPEQEQEFEESIEEEEEESVELYEYTKVPELFIKKIPNEKRTMRNFLTKYEYAKIIGERARQIEMGATVYVDVPKEITRVLDIAELELKNKKVPFIIRRYMPNKYYEDWHLYELILP